MTSENRQSRDDAGQRPVQQDCPEGHIRHSAERDVGTLRSPDEVGRAARSDERPEISIIVPVYNEQDSLLQLSESIRSVMAGMDCAYELIFIDDGSTDKTPARLETLAAAAASTRCITFRRNFGKAAALDAGFKAASGRYVVTMDADLQDDPQEIPKFMDALREGNDVVSGWKFVRHDPIDKTLPSRIFNSVVGRLSGVRLNDFNCGYKAYRAQALEGLSLYGELHRFIPVLLHWRGYRIGEVRVNHHPRQFGQSKYGISRLLKGGLDFLGVMLNTRFATRPLHVFGGAGLIFGLAGFGILTYLTFLWMAGLGPIGDRPLLLFGMLLVMTAFQFITIGLLGEFIQRQGAGRERRYTIGSTLNFEQRPEAEGTMDRQLTDAAQLLAEAARHMKEDNRHERHDHSARYDEAAHQEIHKPQSASSHEPRSLSRRAGR